MYLTPYQGDQIGRIFAQSVRSGRLLTLGRFAKITAKITEVAPRFRVNFDKNYLGYILGDFFTSSSGHPAPYSLCMKLSSPVFMI
jgi:hypothetical protein